MWRLVVAVLAVFAIAHCEHTEKRPPDTQAELKDEYKQALRVKLDNYVRMSAKIRNAKGFVPNCDSVLFSALSMVGGSSVQIWEAEYNGTGRWFRRSEYECYTNEHVLFKSPGSKSDISKDMFVGVLWGLLEMGPGFHEAKERIARTIEYGKDNNWIMGRGPLSETFLTPNIRRDLAELLHEWGGEDHYVIRSIPYLWNSGLKEFPAHLQVIRILWHKALDRTISATMLERIREHHEREPRNALYRFAYECFHGRDFNEVARVLLDEKLFPSSRLPVRGDRCANYLWERDEAEGAYSPCPGVGTHDGADFIFLAGLLLREASI